MLVIILIGTLAVASVFIAIQARLLKQADKDLEASRQRYASLEKGMDEVQENYEQEYLTWDEVQKEQEGIIQSLRRDLETIHPVAEHHANHCIPEFAPILGQEEYVVLANHSKDPDKYVDRIMEYISG